MAEWVDIPLATQAGGSRSSFVSAAELLNLMLVPNPPGSPRPFSIMSTPGLLDVSIGEGAGLIRGMISHGAKIWFVKGTGLYYHDGAAETQVIGGVGSVAGTAPVRMVGTGTDTVVIVADANTYKATTATITAITPPAGTYSDVAHIDGYTVYARSGTDEFYISALDDPTTIDPLDFSTADAIADALVGVVNDHREIVLFGERHIEFWYNAGEVSFPFVRAQPGVAERGCFAAGSIAKYDNSVFFLGDDKRVYRLQGYRPVPVSSPHVERLIATYADTASEVRAGVYVQDGQAFYVLGLAAEGTTYAVAYDIGTGLWHTRLHNALTDSWLIDIATLNESTVLAAYNSGSGGSRVGEIYQYDLATYRDSDGGGADTQRLITCPALDGDGVRMFESAVRLFAEKVAGNVTFLRSDNGGASYTTQSTISLNQNRVQWTRCGSFYRRVHQFLFEANARIAVSHIRAKIDRGAS